jgi:cation diffusion facilitator CzcD-associated flavoprotein CzcO
MPNYDATIIGTGQSGPALAHCFDLDCCHSRGREGRGAGAGAGGAVRARRWCAPAPRFNNFR